MAWETPEYASLDPAARTRALPGATASAFMARVYQWMFAGLALTGGVALYTASNEALLQGVANFRWVLFIAEFGLVLGLSALAPRLSGPLAALMFGTYAVLNGLVFSFLFLVYNLGSIGQAFLLTAGAFGAMSVYATVTHKDLSGWRTFLYMGLVGVLMASLAQFFFHSPGLSFVTSCACVVVFAGLTAYDTQKLRAFYANGSGSIGVGTLAIVGALTLYLDFVNLFLALLRLFGRRRS